MSVANIEKLQFMDGIINHKLYWYFKMQFFFNGKKKRNIRNKTFSFESHFMLFQIEYQI